MRYKIKVMVVREDNKCAYNIYSFRWFDVNKIERIRHITKNLFKLLEETIK